MEVDDVLRELINAAREGTADDCPDWRYRPGWRQRLWAAVRAYDALTGHVPAVQPKPVPVTVVRPAPLALEAPKPRVLVPYGDLSGEFAKFWAHYPRKMEGGRLAAERAYTKARKTAGAEEILAGLLTYPFREDPAYQPSATKWLERGCWMVEADTPPVTTVKERNGKRHEGAELAERLGLDLATPISEQFSEGNANGSVSRRRTGYSLAD